MRPLTLIIFLSIYFLLDWYLFSSFRSLWQDSPVLWRRIWSITYWLLSLLPLLGMLFYQQLGEESARAFRTVLTSGFFIVLLAKIISSTFLFMDDIRRGLVFLVDLIPGVEPKFSKSRSEFMTKVAVGAAVVPMAAMTFGIASGAYDYRVRNRLITSPNLPKEFDGLRVVQVSDIHTGSFFNKTAVSGGVDMINDQKADIAFFTGDLVNNQSKEAKEYLDIFKKIKTPMGTFSVMGNHDYGDYRQWTDGAAKQKDVQDLQDMHRYMGWDILLNENRMLEVDGEKLAILGVENWGAGRFSKYGQMEPTYSGTEEVPFKILLSHDPSHWDAQIRPDYGDIDLMLAGHTHGFQFGVEIGGFKWSPAQYLYKQWADHYQEGDQHLYVNRGFGFLGYPGRVGILPEITVLELKRG